MNAHLQRTIYEFQILFLLVIFSFLHSESSLTKQNKDITVNYTSLQIVQKFLCVCVCEGEMVLIGIVIYDGGVLNRGSGRKILRVTLKSLRVSPKIGNIVSAFFSCFLTQNSLP